MLKHYLIKIILIASCLLVLFSLSACSNTGGLKSTTLNAAPLSNTPQASDESSSTMLPDDGQIPSQTGVTADTGKVFLIDYKEVVRNNTMILYADMQKGLFAVKDIKSGAIWYSTPKDSLLDELTKGKQKIDLRSQVVIDYVYREDENTTKGTQTANSQTACINTGGIKVTKVNNGIRVVYTFGQLDIKIPVEYTLGADYLDATIDVKNIDEGNKCYLIDVNLLPSFGAGNWNDKGYLFIPDGCGAIVNFNNNVKMLNPYNEMVYGDDLSIYNATRVNKKETIRMPVFGIVTGSHALMGIITQGDGAASITALNGNDSCGYNTVSSKAIFRTISTKKSFYTTQNVNIISQISHTPFLLDKYEVRYYSLPPEEASYVGMANNYRKYLVEEKGLKKNPQKPSLALDLYGSADKNASFLGIPYSKQQVLTSFDQANTIINTLKSKGVENVAVQYIGWNNSGILNDKIPANAQPMQSLGGQNAFDKLKTTLKQNNDAFYPDVDFVRYKSSGNGISKLYDSAKTVSGDPAQLSDYLLSIYIVKLNATPLSLLTPQKLSAVADRFLESFQKLDVNSIGLSTIGNQYYSNFEKKDGVYRSMLLSYYESVLKKYQQDNLSIAFDDANAYAIPYASRIYDTPTYSSGYDIFDEDVPFYQIVLHGYVTTTVPSMIQSVDPDVNYLKAIETGSELLYAGIYEPSDILSDTRYNDLYSTTYTLWMNDAVQKYQQYKVLLNQIYNKTIINHQQLEKNVFMTTFEGQIQVIVNYNKNEVVYNGQKVPGMGFLELGGK